MLSILIPTYNHDITSLVQSLHQQAIEQYIDFEILVAEDGSRQHVNTNHQIASYKGCQHILYKKNIGRSAIRNKLADMAQYNHLLFMDCDAEVCSDQFIQKYLSFCKDECIVIGGTAYDENEKDEQYSLRLAYGRKREARTANERARNNFATFNFLISKKIFQKVRFDESIRGYGHEDMLFGHRLHQLGHEFIQIENPLIHKGLDTNEVFIKKTEEATRNLYLLFHTGRYPYLEQESSLLRYFMYIRKMRLTGVVAWGFRHCAAAIRKRLCSPQPSLPLYDLYKLGTICLFSLSK